MGEDSKDIGDISGKLCAFFVIFSLLYAIWSIMTLSEQTYLLLSKLRLPLLMWASKSNFLNLIWLIYP